MSDDERPSMKMDDHEDHNMPEPEHDGAQISDMAVGLAQAKADKKLSNNSPGNNQLAIHGVRSALGNAQRAYKEQYN